VFLSDYKNVFHLQFKRAFTGLFLPATFLPAFFCHGTFTGQNEPRYRPKRILSHFTYAVFMTIVNVQMRSAVRKSSASNEGEQGEEANESITNELAPVSSLVAVQPSSHRIGMVVDMAESNWIGGFLPGQFC
jgi:hypothetical protein